MQNITVGQIAAAIAFLVSLIGGVEFLMARLNKLFDKKLQPITNSIDNVKKELHQEIIQTRLDGEKNFIVKCLNDIENGVILDEATEERLCESYSEYKNNGGNGYIERRWNKVMNK